MRKKVGELVPGDVIEPSEKWNDARKDYPILWFVIAVDSKPTILQPGKEKYYRVWIWDPYMEDSIDDKGSLVHAAIEYKVMDQGMHSLKYSKEKSHSNYHSGDFE
jgi:hypothetical protein